MLYITKIIYSANYKSRQSICQSLWLNFHQFSLRHPPFWAAQLLTDCAQTDELPSIPLVAQHDAHRLVGPGNFLLKPAPACPLSPKLPLSGGGRGDLPPVPYMSNVLNGIALYSQAEHQPDSLGGGPGRFGVHLILAAKVDVLIIEFVSFM